ncbi:hypothetical protein BCV69DRAFT_312728 [Microstroma glucosiphilum]|uniref:CNH domain-containing protein n=1 Tax=Pseudomicrostroma glucosiphilum TaxID=1684307 RepID=A0A316UCM6_9BASI|nr:hypothetical protein BCV69DRAFT_312728 [Pseudomicrostroma glucosiphilum]PWN20785.1 hypothetical protein BCV69DRAFT_312728 [Pseudomicrostroma glucosiphilum]
MSAANSSDPFAVDCVLDGSQAAKDRVSSLAVHGEKLYVGHPSGSLSVFRLPVNASSSSFSETDAAASSSSSTAPSALGKATLVSTHPHFHPQGKQILSLRIVPSLSLIISFSPDGTLHFNSLATLEPDKVPTPIKAVAAKSVVAFEVQTSVCEWPAAEDGSSGDKSPEAKGEGSSRTPQKRIPEPGMTFPRSMNRASSSRTRPLSMFGRQDSFRQQQQAAPEVKLRLLTTLLVSLRRKLLVLRWLDGQPYDWKELSLLHTPRSFAFAPPSPAPTTSLDSSVAPTPSTSNTVFISYGTPSEFGLLDIPPAHLSPAAKLHETSSPPSAKRDFLKDGQEWKKLRELNIPEYAAEYFGDASSNDPAGNGSHGRSESESGNMRAGSGQGEASSSAKAVSTAASSAAAAGGLFGGLGGYIGLGARTKAPILRAVPTSAATKPMSASDNEGEIVVVRDNTAVFLSFTTGNPTRRRGIEWPVAVEDAALLPSQHIFAALPPPSNQSKATIQIRSASTLEVVQTFSVPPEQAPTSSTASSFTVSALVSPPLQSSSSSSTSASLFVVLTPSSANESARVYKLTARTWQARLREMIRLRKWEEAVELVRNDSGEGDTDTKDWELKKRLLPPLLALLSLDRFLAGCAASNSGAAKKQMMQSANAAFESAVDLWIELDLNPTKVLSIFPERIAGQGLSRPRSDWVAIWGEGLTKEGFSLEQGGSGSDDWLRSTSGGLPNAKGAAATSQALATPRDRSKLTSLFGKPSVPASTAGDDSVATAATPALSSSPASTVGSRDTMRDRASASTKATAKTGSQISDKQPASAATRKPAPTSAIQGSEPGGGSATETVAEAVIDLSLVENEALLSRPSLEALGRFLADRRRIFKPILETHPGVSPSPDSAMLELPSIPLASMSLPDLTALARVVDTALFKTFLETKPSLVGPLCRIENWCEVNEVEELLKAKGKHSELISLYGGKDMHDRALGLLKKFSEEEDDEEEKVGPTIRYLQGLGPEHIKVILETSKWVLKQDPKRGMEIFTADTGKVSTFPRLQVVNLLWDFDRDLCAVYLEHIIDNVGEGDPELHEKLGIIYLDRVKAERDGNKGEDKLESMAAYQKLLQFLSESHQYRPERILRRLPIDSLWEVRAVLLGRMGQHKGALSIYVERIGGEEGEAKAEEYCTKVYERRGSTAQDDDEGSSSSAEEARGIFLLLLKLYLRPAEPTKGETDATRQHDLSPALRLLSRHPSSLELGAVLSLLPPLVPISAISTFLFKGLQASHRSHSHNRVIASISKEYSLQVDERLAGLKSRRVKVTQGRTCGVCGKRLGVSVLAVSNTGEAMHYGCKQ